MDSCGSQTLVRPKGSRGSHLDQAGHGGLRQWMVRKLVWFIFLGLLSGCAPTIKFGSPPKVKDLGTLKPGISSKADAVTVLGEPRGYGTARFPSLPTSREIWLYEYTEAEGKRVNLQILLVFFDKELYDGHLWFSSAQLLEVTD